MQDEQCDGCCKREWAKHCESQEGRKWLTRLGACWKALQRQWQLSWALKDEKSVFTRQVRGGTFQTGNSRLGAEACLWLARSPGAAGE